MWYYTSLSHITRPVGQESEWSSLVRLASNSAVFGKKRPLWTALQWICLFVFLPVSQLIIDSTLTSVLNGKLTLLVTKLISVSIKTGNRVMQLPWLCYTWEKNLPTSTTKDHKLSCRISLFTPCFNDDLRLKILTFVVAFGQNVHTCVPQEVSIRMN